MKKLEPKGWCPSTLRPMMSGDGLIIRIKPSFSRLASSQAQKIAVLSKRYGNGFMDITNRGNLQIRGLTQDSYPLVLEELQNGNITKKNKSQDELNLILAPFITRQSQGWQCAKTLYNIASTFPYLPAKFGFAIDCGIERYLCQASADIRIETNNSGKLLIRFDGCDQGFITSEETFAIDILRALKWFVVSQNNSHTYKRMHQLVSNVEVPFTFRNTAPCQKVKSLTPGLQDDKIVFAAPFSQITTDQMMEIAGQTQEIIFTINRCLIVDKTVKLSAKFITSKDDFRYNITACPGMPGCSASSIDTKGLALKISRHHACLADQSYHISGCSKGCSTPKKSDVCIVGENGSHNLLQNGYAWDIPSFISLSEAALINELINLQKTKKNAL